MSLPYLSMDFAFQAVSLQHLEASLDPTIELKKLLSDDKFEEAFTKALSLSSISTVAWLCKQVRSLAMAIFLYC